MVNKVLVACSINRNDFSFILNDNIMVNITQEANEMFKKQEIYTDAEDEAREAKRAEYVNTHFDVVADVEEMVFNTPNDIKLGSSIRKYINKWTRRRGQN